MNKRVTFSNLDKVLTAEELRMLLGAAKKADGLIASRDYAWMTLVINTGIKPSMLVSLTLFQADRAISEKQFAIDESTIELNDEAIMSLKHLVIISRDMGTDDAPDTPLLSSRKRGAPTVRALELRMEKWCEAAFLPRLVTINHLIQTAHVKQFVERYSYLLEI